MIQIAMTREQFEARCAELKAKEGIVLSGDKGEIHKSGVAASYAYDGATLTVNVLVKPFLFSMGHVEDKIHAWLAGS